jgi:hypothetical protein
MVGWALADQPAGRASRSVMDEIQQNARRAADLALVLEACLAAGAAPDRLVLYL